MTRYAMVIDLQKCIGCHTCAIACKAENSTGPGIFWLRVLDEEMGKFPAVTRHVLPKACMHCQNAPCVEACPTGASQQNANGTVTVDRDKCIGCKYCMVACPYEARSFNEKIRGYYGEELIPNEVVGAASHKEGVVEKCTFCSPRLERGGQPACVEICPAESRYFGDLDDPESEVAALVRSGKCTQLLADLGTEPSVYYKLGR